MRCNGVESYGNKFLHIHNIEHCLHTSCNAGEYAEFVDVEDFSDNVRSCEFDVSVVVEEEEDEKYLDQLLEVLY